ELVGLAGRDLEVEDRPRLEGRAADVEHAGGVPRGGRAARLRRRAAAERAGAAERGAGEDRGVAGERRGRRVARATDLEAPAAHGRRPREPRRRALVPREAQRARAALLER